MRRIILSVSAAAALALPAIFSSSQASADPALHPDCVDNQHPQLCTFFVNQLEDELIALRQAFVAGNLNTMASFYMSPGAVVKIGESFYRGHSSYRNDFLGPFYANMIRSADFDVSNTRFQMVSPGVIVQYGTLDAGVTFQDNSTGVISSRAMLVWVYNGGPDRPFLVAAEFDESL